LISVTSTNNNTATRRRERRRDRRHSRLRYQQGQCNRERAHHVSHGRHDQRRRRPHGASTATNRATATADAAGGGIVGGDGAVANAIVTPVINASITGNVDVTGAVTVRVQTTTDADSEAQGTSGGLLGIGSTRSTSTVSPNIDAFNRQT
jgi:hypothetical protein